MASRIDRKFLLTLGIVATIGVAGVVVAVLVLQPWGPGRSLQRAEAAAAEGDWKRAFIYYGRAFGKDPGNPEFLELTLNALRNVVPETASEARERYGNLNAIMDRRTRVGRPDAQRWTEYLDFIADRAILTEDAAAWKLLDEAAALMAQSFPASDPAHRTALEYRMLAAAEGEGALRSDEREAAIRLARELSGRHPDSARIWGTLALLETAEWLRIDAGGRNLEAAVRLAELEELLARAAAAGGVGVDLDLARLRIAANRLQKAPEDELANAEIDLILRRLAERSASLRGGELARVVRAMVGTGRMSSVPLAVGLLSAHLEANPNDLFHAQLLAVVQQFNDPAEARRIAAQLLAKPRQPVGLVAAWQDQLGLQSAVQIFDQDARRWATLGNDREREAVVAELRKSLETIAQLTAASGDDSLRLRSEAKLDLMTGNPAGAAAKFEEVIRRGRFRDLDTFYQAAIALREVGEVGRALELLDQAQQQSPDEVNILALRGELNLRIGRNDTALSIAAILDERDPGNETAAKIRTAAERIEAVATGSGDDPATEGLKEAETAYNAGDLAAAERTLAALRREFPEDPRIPRAQAQVAVRQERFEAAGAFAEDTLRIDPRDAGMLRLRALLASTDPIERIEMLTRDNHQGDAAELAGRLFAAFETARRQFQAESERLLPEDPEKARQLSELAIRAAESAQRYRQEVEAGDASGAAITAMVDTAIAENDFERARRIASAAETVDDPTLKPLLIARIESANGDLAAALRSIDEGLKTSGSSSVLHRERGVLLEALGRGNDALEAYGEALSRRPNDMEALRRRAGMLARLGRFNEALELLRTGRRLAPQNRTLEDAWLAFEGDHGDARLALERRRERYRLDPSELRNAVGLARLLLTEAPGREDILDRQGRPRFAAGQWETMSAADRRRELESVQAARRSEGLRIFEVAMAAAPDDFDLVVAYSDGLRRVGRGADGEAAMRGYLERRGDEAASRDWLAFGTQLAEAGRGREALEAFSEAATRQDPATREADLVLGDFWFRRGNWEQALVHLDAAVAVNPTREAQLRRAEALAKLGRVDEATAAVAAVEGRDLTVVLLEAMVADGKAQALLRGATPEASAEDYRRFESLIAEAKQLAPASPLPLVQEAVSLRNRAAVSGDPGQLAAAVESVDAALRIDPSNGTAVRLRAELLVERDDLTGAIATLEEHLRVNGDSDETRRQLIQLLIRGENLPRALAVVNEAIRRNPSDPNWPFTLGELRLREGSPESALDSFRTAYELQASPGTLHRIVDTQMRLQPPDYRGVLEMVARAPDALDRSILLRSAEAAALVQTGRTELGRDRMAEAYRLAKEALAAGRVGTIVLDPWYANLRLVLPDADAARTEAFVRELAGGELQPLELRWLSEFAASAGRGGLPRARALLEEAIARDNGREPVVSARLHLDRGNLAYLDGDCAGAVASFERSISGGVENPQTLNNLAFILADCLSDPTRAIPYIERAIRLSPNTAEYLDTYGFALWKAGRMADAEEALLRSLRVRPTALANYHLAEVLASNGNAAAARSTLQRALQLGPDEKTRQAIERLSRALP